MTIDPQIVTLHDTDTMLEAIPLTGTVALDKLKFPRGKWKPVVTMTADEARKLAACLNAAADQADANYANRNPSQEV